PSLRPPSPRRPSGAPRPRAGPPPTTSIPGQSDMRLEHRSVYLRSRNRGFASHLFVAPRSLGGTQLPRRASICSQLHALARSGKPIGALVSILAVAFTLTIGPSVQQARAQQPPGDEQEES